MTHAELTIFHEDQGKTKCGLSHIPVSDRIVSVTKLDEIDCFLCMRGAAKWYQEAFHSAKEDGYGDYDD